MVKNIIRLKKLQTHQHIRLKNLHFILLIYKKHETKKRKNIEKREIREEKSGKNVRQ